MVGDEMEIKEMEGHISDIPKPCKTCLYWEAPTEYQNDNGDEEAILKKKAWFDETLREFGNCGFLAYENGKVVGYAQYAPAERFLNVARYPTAPPTYEEDTVFLACLFVVDKGHRGGGIGTRLLERVIDDVKARGFGSIETFARRENPNNPSGPACFYEKHGFKVKKEHPRYPLLSLDLDEI